MATASILSRVTAPVVKADITDASRDDLALNDVVELESVGIGTAYQWNLAFKPEDSTAVLSSSGNTQSINRNPGTFTVDKPGPYLTRLLYTTRQITVNTVLAAGVTFSINGITLTAVAGARTPGSNDFSVSSGTVAGITADMVAAINDAANSFAAANLAGTDASPSVIITPTTETAPTGETLTILYSGTASDVTIADYTTEQYVRLRALTAFGDLKLVAAGERYDTLRVPVDATAAGWADEQNFNLNVLLSLVKATSALGNVRYVDAAGGGDYTAVQSAIDFAVSQAPTSAQQWVILIRPGTYTEDLTFAPFVHVFGWPGGRETEIVKVLNATNAGHVVAIPGAGDTLALADIHFRQPVVSPNAAFIQTGSGDVRVFRCTLEAQGNTGEVWFSQGPTYFTECIINGNGVAATDYALRTTTLLVLDRTFVNGMSCVRAEGGLVHAKDTRFKPTGTYAINTNASETELYWCRVGGLIAANPTGAAVPGDLIVSCTWSEAKDITIDGAGVVGAARVELGSSTHDTVTPINAATVVATVPSDTNFYDSTATGLTAANVQAALDEIYTYAAAVRTLDDAYDGGVAGTGSGRSIVADQGAVQILDSSPPSSPTPAGNTNGNLEVLGSVSLGALTKPEITVDPNPFGNGPVVLLGREIWANDAPFGSTALVLGDASGNPTYHNYNLRVGTKSADGGTKVGSTYIRSGDSLTTIDAGSVFIQGGSATDAGGGSGGDVYIVPGQTAGGADGKAYLVDPSTATAATLTAAGAFVGGVAGDITFGSEMGSATVSVLVGDAVADVWNKIDATGIFTAAGDPIVISTVAKGASSEVFFISADAGVDAAVGGLSGQVMAPGTWPDAVPIKSEYYAGNTPGGNVTWGVGGNNTLTDAIDRIATQLVILLGGPIP